MAGKNRHTQQTVVRNKDSCSPWKFLFIRITLWKDSCHEWRCSYCHIMHYRSIYKI